MLELEGLPRQKSHDLHDRECFPDPERLAGQGAQGFFIVHLRLGPGPASAGRPGAASRSPVGPPPRSAPHAAEAAPAPRSTRLPAPGAPHPSAPATPPLPASHPVPSATGSRWPRAHAPVPTPQLQQPLRTHSRPQTADHGAPLAAPPPAALHLPLHLAHLLHPRPVQVPSQRQRRPPPAHRRRSSCRARCAAEPNRSPGGGSLNTSALSAYSGGWVRLPRKR